MFRHKLLVSFGLVAVVAGSIAAMPASAADSRMIPSSGSATFQSGPEGVDGLSQPEFASSGEEGAQPYSGTIVDRSASQGGSNGASASNGPKSKSKPELKTSFDGLNHRQQRLANGGNQFSVEPPDQGLCVGNGFVMESVNDVLAVYDHTGTTLIGPVDLNTFYGYPAAIVRATRTTPAVFGPLVTDPSCYFDRPTQRWFQVVLTLDTHPTNGHLTGKNHLDIAVSQTSNPTGLWTIYRVPVQDDGSDGTPNDGCSLGPCIGDYPHIGADANGFYVTTNEYSFFGPEFHGAQVYAFSKAALASNATSVAVTQFDTHGLVAGNSGFTLWPASTPGNAYEIGAGGTEYFMSSNAADDAHGDGTKPGPGTSSQLLVWALSNTQSLNTASPSLTLSHTILAVGEYAIPPKSDQKSGNFPLGQCINDTTMSTPLGLGCWRVLVGSEPAHTEVESHLDSNDTRMQQVVFANGKLWGALDTALTVSGANKAGIEWFIVKPSISDTGVSGTVALQGYLGLADNNLTYPAIAVNPSGRGVMAFTVTGANHFPSAGYAGIDALIGVGDVSIAAEGVGPDDGFTSYKAFVGNPPRTRWGDYGAAVADGLNIWIASEYIGQACTLAQYADFTSFPANFGSCDATRTTLGNWDTRISELSVR